MSEERGPLLAMEGISLTLGGREILRQVDLQVGPGEIVTVVGPNGAGKTCLLRIALGLLAPDGGKVRLRPGARLGYMPQRLPLDESLPLTVHRFLSLGSREPRSRQEEVLAEVGLKDAWKAPLQGLSGGEFQRALLARALLRDPDLLVLDEPAQGVDIHGQVDLFRLLTRIRQERGCAILLVSHDLHLVMASTDRVVCLNRHVCCTGVPSAVTADPAFLELFGHLGAGNLALYPHDDRHRHP